MINKKLKIKEVKPVTYWSKSVKLISVRPWLYDFPMCSWLFYLTHHNRRA